MTARMRRAVGPVASALLLAAGGAVADATPSAAEDPIAGAESVDALTRLGNARLFAGDFDASDEVWDAMRRRYPEHPAPDVLAVDTLFFRQIYDEDDTRYDAEIERRANRALALGEAALARTPDDALLHLYTGKALMQLGRLTGVRGHYYRAGTYGERGRVHLERAAELAPELVDAKFQLGLYYYYANFLPSVVQWLDFLWFVPSGNGDEGLALLELVAREGDLERDHARFMLASIEAYHRDEVERGWERIAGLHADYPDNTMIHFELVEMLYMLGRYRETREEALAMEASPRTGRLHDGRKTMARVWRARAEVALGEPERALETLSPLLATEPESPTWARAWVRLAHGHALDALGRRAEALEQYASVQTLAEPYDSERASRRAQQAIDAPYRPVLPAVGAPAQVAH